MNVEIVQFPETKVALIRHCGPPELEHDTVRKLVAWKIENRFLNPERYRSYGVHYTDSRISSADHRVDFCLSIEQNVGENSFGIEDGRIPACRCAKATDVGHRFNNTAAKYLWEQWLPESGETPGDLPMFFHYVNVGPLVRHEEMITDVYLPLRPESE
jgi:AraC family transcriptional regulator